MRTCALLLAPFIPLFMLAAAADALVGARVSAGSAFDPWTWCLAFLALVLAMATGVACEDRIRKRSFDALSAALFESGAPTARIEATVPVDLDTVAESFSFYSHDLAWALALFAVFIGSVVLAGGPLAGATAACATGLLCAGLYRTMYRRLIKSRDAVFASGKLLVTSLTDLARADGSWAHAGIRARWLRASLCLGPYRRFVEAKSRLFVLRSRLSILLGATFHLLLVAVAGWALLAQDVATHTLGLVVAALMGMHGEAMKLFAASSGLLSTAPAFDRVRSLPRLEHDNWPRWSRSASGFFLHECYSPLRANRYHPAAFMRGVNWITGRSGSGKSVLLQALFWSARAAGIRTAYLSEQELEVLTPDPAAFLQSIIASRDCERLELLIIDEGFARVREWQELVVELHRWAVSSGSTVLAVDHRFERAARLPGPVYDVTGDAPTTCVQEQFHTAAIC
jgi:hypothetical protein